MAELRSQVARAEIAALDQAGAACCYDTSNKYCVTDAQGIAWEIFHTLDSVPVFAKDGRNPPATQQEAACCAPATKLSRIRVRAVDDGACCG